MKKIRHAPSKRITVRFHDDEIEKIEKGMKKHKMMLKSDYIRHKTLTK